MKHVSIYNSDHIPTGDKIAIEDICHPWPGTEEGGFHSVHPRIGSGLPSHVLVRDKDIAQAGD